jgi:adenylate kinase
MSPNNHFGVIIIFGPPGSGKGTQANLLSDKFNLYHLETSRLLEEKFRKASEKDEIIQINGENFSVQKEKEIWERGELCSPPFVTWIVQEKIKQLAKDNRGIVFSGTPRTVYEAQKLLPLLKDFYGSNITILRLKLSLEVSLWRNSHRRICSLMRHPIIYNEETKNLTICPLDGSKLVKRGHLDDPETIKIRWEEFENRTLPILDYFKSEGFEIKEINGEQTVEAVFKEILKKLNLNDSNKN